MILNTYLLILNDCHTLKISNSLLSKKAARIIIKGIYIYIKSLILIIVNNYNIKSFDKFWKR